MQASTKDRDAANGASFAARARGHVPHMSISDDSHHVTETIGFLYGSDYDRDPRRASNAPSVARISYYGDRSPDGEETTTTTSPQGLKFPPSPVQESRHSALTRSEQPNGPPRPHPSRENSVDKANGHAMSPMAAARAQSPQETAQSHFPLTDIDYESSPAAVAQELSNLQALRRMSMDVHAAGDPDLPSLNRAAIPPSPTASDDDSSRLFWVPARLHPELAPKEFKTFLESKAEQIKRRSGDLSSLGSSPMSSRSPSLGSNSSGLTRKKSMLSREVNNSTRYQDGADILERKRSLSSRNHTPDPNLAELESLVANNLHLQRPASPDDNEDFILPSVPASTLKRSTKTKYQRGGGGIKARGERPQRGAKKAPTPDQERPPGPDAPVPDIPTQFASFASSDAGNLADTLSFPAAKSPSSTQNFSRPAARSPSPPQADAAHSPVTAVSFDSILSGAHADRLSTQSAPDPHLQRRHIISPDRHSVPHAAETPQSEELATQMTTAESIPEFDHQQPQPPPIQQRHPARTSSREVLKPAPRPTVPRTHSSANVVPVLNRTDVSPITTTPRQTLDQPSPLPGNDTNTSNLSFIPTLTVDKQSQDKKETKKSSWGWLLGKDEDREKGKGKSGKVAQAHDGTRLDLLQTSIDGSSKRRETIEIDRDSLRLEEERKKESQRKAGSGEKKEKDSIFSTLFSSKKSKAEKEAKKSSNRVSPEPPYRELKPDIDYSWTRFSILEERAIYRMAHIKLANPRRPLYSQVLLSNFMYSYLAKVQQMHPQMNLPTSAKQQKKQKEQQPQQSEEFSTYQRYQQQQEQIAAQSASQQQQPVAYEGQYATTTYEQSNSRPSSRGSSHSGESPQAVQYTNHNSYSYRPQNQQGVQQYETDRENEMW